MDKLDVQIIRSDDVNQFAVLPWTQFEALLERLEDAEDLADLRLAKLEQGDKPGRPLEDVMRELGLRQPNESAA